MLVPGQNSPQFSGWARGGGDNLLDRCYVVNLFPRHVGFPFIAILVVSQFFNRFFKSFSAPTFKAKRKLKLAID